MPRKNNKKLTIVKNKSFRKKKRTKRKRGVGLLPDKRKIMANKVKTKLFDLMTDGVINDNIYNCIIRSDDIFEITTANIEEGLKLKKDEIVKFLLINSECDYIGKTIKSLEKEIKQNLPKDFYNCIKSNNLIEQVVVNEINKGFFRNSSELVKIIMTEPECEDFEL